ncbi:MAG: DNA polymerase III subunit delta' [Chloroflexi bacterium]|nr:DNA polymerase III subunit delta' [Chloroflexota bacterium]
MWQVIGHTWAVDLLRRSLAGGRLAHAYLITGPEHIGKTHLALEFAAALVCEGDDAPCHRCVACGQVAQGQHPDVLQVEPDGSHFKIDQVRGLQYDLALSPREAKRRVCILTNFERATTEAANALLKTLEEPPPHVVLIVTATDASLLLPTIVSRCQLLALRIVPRPLIEEALLERTEDAALARLLSSLAGGRVGWALEALVQPDLLQQRQEDIRRLWHLLSADRAQRLESAEELAKRQNIGELLAVWQVWWRDVVLLHGGCEELVVNQDLRRELGLVAAACTAEQSGAALRYIARMPEQLEHNVNARLALEALLLSWPRVSIKGEETV